MCRFSSPDSPSWGCNCHNERERDLSDHKHIMYLTIKCEVRGAPTGDEERDIEENDLRFWVLGELKTLVTQVSMRERNRLFTHKLKDLFDNIDEDPAGCDTCSEIDAAFDGDHYTGPDTTEEAEGLR